MNKIQLNCGNCDSMLLALNLDGHAVKEAVRAWIEKHEACRT